MLAQRTTAAEASRLGPTDAPFFFLIAFVSVLARLLSCFNFLAALAYTQPGKEGCQRPGYDSAEWQR